MLQHKEEIRISSSHCSIELFLFDQWEEYELAVGNIDTPCSLNFEVAGLRHSSRCNSMGFIFACYTQNQEFYHTCKHAAAAHVNDHISI